MNRLEAIEKRARERTKGVWGWVYSPKTWRLFLAVEGPAGPVPVVGAARWGMFAGAPTFQRDGEAVRASEFIAVEDQDRWPDRIEVDHPDAHLLAHAADDIDYLLGEVKLLQALLEARNNASPAEPRKALAPFDPFGAARAYLQRRFASQKAVS